MKLFYWLLLTVLTMPLQAQNYDPTFFPVGVWSVKGDHRLEEDYLYNDQTTPWTTPDAAAGLHEILFTDLEDNGFNAAVMNLDPIAYTLHSICDKALEHNIKIVAGMEHLYAAIKYNDVTEDSLITAILADSIEYLKNHDAVLGYYVFDEPRENDISFINLDVAQNNLVSMTNGNHPVLSTWNDERTMADLSFLDLSVLMIDAYPFSDTTAPRSLSNYMPAYFTNYDDPPAPGFSAYIEKVRKNHSNPVNNRPFWVFLQAFGEPDGVSGFWRQVEPNEIRLQAWVALMQGAKGIWYFLYETETNDETGFARTGLVESDGEPNTDRLIETKNINTQINKISEILLKLDVVEDSGASVDKGEIRLHDDLSVETDDKYAIVVNTNYDTDIVVTIPLAEIGYAVNSVVDKVTDANIPFTQTATAITFTVSLDKTDGSLYHLSAQSPLPIEMARFSASKYNNQVKLSWTTLSEKNNKGFQIEKSVDGQLWQVMGYVNGLGSSHSEYTYSFIDAQPIQGVNYYRLMQEDFDNKYEYSQIIQVLFEGTRLGFYPNPAKNTLHFLTHGHPLQKVFIYSTTGQLILELEHPDEAFDVSQLQKGIYLLRAQSDSEVLTAKLVIE